jgi:methylmalonyl-CoA decarboxylase
LHNGQRFANIGEASDRRGEASDSGGIDMSLVTTETRASVGIVMFDHAAKRNALSEALIEEITVAFDEFRAADVRAVVLRAQPGARVWSAGHDVSELPERGRDPLGWSDPLRIVIRAIQDFPAPVIALIEGGVWGGACELAMACDMLVATPDASFAITPAKISVPYNLGGLVTLVNMIPLPIAKEMLFTAQPISAQRALDLGIINYIRPAADIEAFIFSLAEKIKANSPLSIGAMKEALRLLAGAHAISPDLFERIQGLRRIVYDSADYQEGIDAFRQKRKPEFLGK